MEGAANRGLISESEGRAERCALDFRSLSGAAPPAPTPDERRRALEANTQSAGRLGVVAEVAGHERVDLTLEGHFEKRLVVRIGDVDSHGRGVNVEGGAVNQIQDGGDIG